MKTDLLFWVVETALHMALKNLKSPPAQNALKETLDVLLRAARQETSPVLTRIMNEELAREAREMGDALANFVMTRKTVD